MQLEKTRDKTKQEVSSCALSYLTQQLLHRQGICCAPQGFFAEAADVLPAVLVQSSAPLPPDMLTVAWKGGWVIETR